MRSLLAANLAGYITGTYNRRREALVFVESAYEDATKAFTDALASSDRYAPRDLELWEAE